MTVSKLTPVRSSYVLRPPIRTKTVRPSRCWTAFKSALFTAINKDLIKLLTLFIARLIKYQGQAVI